MKQMKQMKLERLLISLLTGTALLLIALGLLTAEPPSLAQAPGAPAASVIYVDADAGGANDGSSWADAYIRLQDGLDAAVAGDEIWVAGGVYTPTNVAGREATFQLESGVALYGGFAATETLRTQRDWEAHVTVLSGDLDGNDATDPSGVVTHTSAITGSNAYHVVTASDVNTDTTVLDGFTITAGNADGSYPDYCGSGMYNNGGSLTLTNVTFSGNTASFGGGMYNRSADSTLTNVTFAGNTAGAGGGMYGAYSSPSLANITFSGNTARGGGGGMYHYSGSPTLTNVTFAGNTAGDTGGGMHTEYGSSILTNVTFSGNTAGYTGGGMHTENDPSVSILTNVTFSGNTAHFGGGIYKARSTNLILRNSILWGNSGSLYSGQAAQIYIVEGTVTVAYSLVQGGIYNGTGNISADPHFVDADGPDDVLGTPDDDLRLRHDSPAIDAGDNSAVPTAVTTDLEGNPRFADVLAIPDTGAGTSPIVDMGAYEQAVSTLHIVKTITPTSPLAPGAPLTYTLSFANPGATTYTGLVITDTVPALVVDVTVDSHGVAITDTLTSPAYVWQVSDLAPGQIGVITIAGRISPLIAHALTFTNTATVASTPIDTSLIDNDSSVQVHVTGLIYVDADATGAGDGSFWVDAFPRLQNGLSLAEPGDEIWVAEGVYTPTNIAGREATFQLESGVALYGGFAATETLRTQRDWDAHITVLSGDLDGNDATDPSGVVTSTDAITGSNAYHVVAANDVSTGTVLDGFTITAGNADRSDSHCSHCYGGGIYNHGSSPTLINVTFAGNNAYYGGGGIYNRGGSPALANVTFAGNTAGGSGGGMGSSNGSPTLTDVTFFDNDASTGGGMYICGKSPILTNIIFAGNTADNNGGGILVDEGGKYYVCEPGVPTLTNATFTGNTADGVGGGMFNIRSVILANVTFSGNTAGDKGGGIYHVASYLTLHNGILWGNMPNQIDGYIADVSYTIVQGGYAGTHVLDRDPRFVDADGPDDVIGTPDDNLRLAPGSAAIDAGDNAAVPAEIVTDLDGHPRFADILAAPDTGSGTAPIVDMGAYEADFTDLYIWKTVSPDRIIFPGDSIEYVLTFVNGGSAINTGIVITDVVPSIVEVTSAISSGVPVTDTHASHAYVWEAGALAPGQVGVITITGVISPDMFSGSLYTGTVFFTNTASIATTSVDTDTTNNQCYVRSYTAEEKATYLPLVSRNASGQDALLTLIPGDGTVARTGDLTQGPIPVIPLPGVVVAVGVLFNRQGKATATFYEAKNSSNSDAKEHT